MGELRGRSCTVEDSSKKYKLLIVQLLRDPRDCGCKNEPRCGKKNKKKKNKPELQILFIFLFNYFYVYFSRTKYSSALLQSPLHTSPHSFLFSWLTMSFFSTQRET